MALLYPIDRPKCVRKRNNFQICEAGTIKYLMESIQLINPSIAAIVCNDLDIEGNISESM